MVIIISALPPMISPPSLMTTIFLPSLQTLSMMHGNTTSRIESNTIRTGKTTTVVRMLVYSRLGSAIFPPPDTQFAEPTNTDF